MKRSCPQPGCKTRPGGNTRCGAMEPLEYRTPNGDILRRRKMPGRNYYVGEPQVDIGIEYIVWIECADGAP